LFERNGFISPLDCHIWEETFKLLRKWIDTGVEPIKLSVNISRCDFFNLDIFTVFSALLEKYQIPTHLICVEITETACVQNFNAVLKAVEPLRKLGIDIHLDDFGSGYSSLTVLSTLPLDLIKLDRAFLSGDFLAPSNVNLMKAIVNISTIMNIPLLIEGVEKEEQAKFMLELGCSTMQGYYFEVPLSVEDFEKKYFSKTM
ncbi:MAG: EAL domain-containing protein, partial [Anaerotignaceae bacterium]